MAYFSCALAILAFTAVAGTGEAAEWEYSLGLHSMAVRDVDSDTYGIGGGATVDGHTSAGRHLFGSFDVFLDHDQDHLDPDHIPVWWQVHLGMDGQFWQGSRGAFVGWTADNNTRMNTVSSVEREIRVLPAMVFGYERDSFQASLKGGYGYFFLEIDDDAPRLRGYDRTNLRQTTGAHAFAADATFHVGPAWQVFGQAEKWWDGGDWLQSQYTAGFRVDTGGWVKGSELILNAELYEYNLDGYSTAGAPPVLGWDDDLTIRVDLRFARPRAR